MEPLATSAFDQLSGVISDVRNTVATHYQVLVLAGFPTDAAAEMAGEVQTALLVTLFPKLREPGEEDE